FAVGPAATVRVVPPPEENRPASYIGAIGSNILVRAAMDAAACKIGDPLQLTLTLSGDIRLDKVTPPRLSQQTNLTAHFDIYDDTVQTIKGERQRRYVYTVRPKTDGRLEFPPIETAYFDTLDRLYRKVLTDPIPIQVARGAEISATQVVGSFTNRPVSPLKQAAPNLLSASPAVFRASPPPPPESLVSPRLCGIALAGPLLFVLAIAGRFLRGRFRTESRQRRRKSAAARALARLRKTDFATSPASRELCAILRQFIGERFDISTASLTPVELERRLLAVSVSSQTAGNCRAFFECHFNVSFTPVRLVRQAHSRHAQGRESAGPLDPSKEADRLQGLIHDIDKEARIP
ncbi:MAG: BatD family protein, partial [Lentisphaerae bacterium]|nr:BatD family protein [Lentisphaerota bacterium]